MTTFKTRPFFLADLRGALVSKYGIEAGEVFALKSFLGVNSGGPRLPVSKVTRTHANGFLIGDIVFGEGSHDPVKWERVLFPQRKLKAVNKTLKSSLSEGGAPAQSVKGAWKSKSAHFGTRGAELAPTALPRLRAKTPSGTCIDNRDGTISHVEAGLMSIRAPWGMEWNGDQFVGKPITANWMDATGLFGKGVFAAYPLYFNKLDRVEGQALERGRCKVRFAGFDDWSLITVSQFHTLFAPTEEPSAHNLGLGWEDPEREQKVAAAKEELRSHIWPQAGTPSPTIARLYPELSNCRMRLWTADNAQDNCGWAFVGDSYDTLCDVKAREKLLVLLVRKSYGREHEGRTIEDMTIELPPVEI